MRSSSNFQPLRELCAAITILSVLAGWITYLFGNHPLATAFFETGLIAIIAGECYARD